jgi:hypothetical protein
MSTYKITARFLPFFLSFFLSFNIIPNSLASPPNAQQDQDFVRLRSSISVSLPDDSQFRVAMAGDLMPVPLTPAQFIEWAKQRVPALTQKLRDVNSNAIRIVRINYVNGNERDLPLENGLITKDNRAALIFLTSGHIDFLY